MKLQQHKQHKHLRLIKMIFSRNVSFGGSRVVGKWKSAKKVFKFNGKMKHDMFLIFYMKLQQHKGFKLT